MFHAGHDTGRVHCAKFLWNAFDVIKIVLARVFANDVVEQNRAAGFEHLENAGEFLRYRVEGMFAVKEDEVELCFTVVEEWDASVLVAMPVIEEPFFVGALEGLGGNGLKLLPVVFPMATSPFELVVLRARFEFRPADRQAQATGSTV